MGKSGVISPPYPSPALQSQTSSRSSLSGDRPNQHAQRRNKDALRDYYNLAESAQLQKPIDSDEVSPSPDETFVSSEFDDKTFNIDSYSTNLLENEDIYKILSVESRLVRDIRGLDGERKALVYDNYSKLIAATDTIKRMRSSMDPLTPTTETLKPAIGRIETMSEELSADLRGGLAQRTDSTGDEKQMSGNIDARRQVVKWVLAAPQRLQLMVNEGRHQAATEDWQQVCSLLDKWAEVPGATDVMHTCQAILQASGSQSA